MGSSTLDVLLLAIRTDICAESFVSSKGPGAGQLMDIGSILLYLTSNEGNKSPSSRSCRTEAGYSAKSRYTPGLVDLNEWLLVSRRLPYCR